MDLNNASSLLEIDKKCAVSAGIYPHWFISFGTLLGAARPTLRKIPSPHYTQGIIEHDDDMDIGIFADNITHDQESAYIDNLRSAGCFRHREEYARRSDNGRLLWCSIRRDPAPVGTKCCHWFFYSWRGYMWHTKGKNWLNEAKFPSSKYPHGQKDDAIAKGILERSLTPGELFELDFEGGRYNVPVRFGACLDFWYPSWLMPRIGGASATEYIMRVPQWSERKSWKIF